MTEAELLEAVRACPVISLTEDAPHGFPWLLSPDVWLTGRLIGARRLADLPHGWEPSESECVSAARREAQRLGVRQRCYLATGPAVSLRQELEARV